MFRLRSNSRRNSTRKPREIHRRLWLQGLEDRSVPALLMVTLPGDANAADPGDPTSKGDLRYVLGLANSNGVADTITFAPSITNVPLSSVTGQLVISEAGKGLLIDGGGLVTIRNTAAQGASSRVFNITSTGGPAIELKGLTLTGGDLSSGNNGGAVQFTDQSLTIRNSVLTGNKTASAGGAVATTTAAANLTITDSTLTFNTATTTGGAVHTGGDNTNVTINGSVFKQNTAVTTGGALNLGAASTFTNVTINGPTVFQFNTSGSHGGAINGGSSLSLNTTNARFESNTSGGNGGAIASSGNATSSSTITLNSSVFSKNVGNTISSNGGAISTAGPATFEASDSTFVNNVAVGNGGGLRFGSANTAATLTRCAVNDNIGAVGGAISLDSPSPGATLLIDQTTIAGNQALGTTKGGGAIFTSPASISLRNSTVSGNVTYGSQGGGAIEVYSAGFSGTVVIESSTVTNNSAPNGRGGAIFTRSTPTTGGTFTLINSIIAGNNASAGPEFFNLDPGAAGGTRSMSADYCLVGSNENNSVILTSLIGSIVGASDTMPLNPMLAPLSTNGGIGKTHLPLPGSPAKLTGSTTLTLDQLGQTRTGTTDIGAVEWEAQPPTGVATLANVSVTGSTYTATVVFSDNVSVKSASILPTNVLLSGPGYAIPVAPISAEPSGVGTVTATYQFAAPGGSWNKSHNGTYTLSLVGGQVTDNSVPAHPAIASVLGSFQVAIGESFVVTVTGDENDGDLSPGDLSLREAITLANADVSSPDTITFDASAGKFDVARTMNVGALGQMQISGPVTITGPAAQLSLNANQLSRHFRVDGPGQFAVTMEQLTLTGGKATGTTATDRGGSMLITDEAVTLSKMNITGNEAATAGGAISVNAIGDLTIVDSTLSGNAAKGTTGTGGAVYMGAFYVTSFTLTRSTVSANTSTRNGGGLVLRGTVLIQDSTIDNNTATDATTAFVHGGGVFFNGNPSRSGWVIRNSTISGNVTKDSGGGIGFTATSASLLVQNSTITNNTANTTSLNNGTGGGGIAVVSTSVGSSSVTLDSTIVAGNFSGNDNDDIATASTLIANFSAVGVPTMIGGGTSVYNGGVNGTAPLLAPLDFYGGPTRTHALQSGSPMLNAGSNPAGLTFDQRGTGFPRVTGSPLQADIGAFEGITPIPGASGSFFDITNPGNMPDTISITYNDDNAIDVSTIGVDDISIKAPNGSFLTILSATPSGSGNSVQVTYQFAIPGGGWDPVDNGTYTVTVVGGKVFDLDTPARSVPTTVVGFFKVRVAGTLTVDTNIDESDSNFGPGDLSFREAIELINLAQFGGSTINFDPTFFATDRTINVSSSGKGELKITTPVSIEGPTTSKLTVTGNNAVRVFNVDLAGTGNAAGLSNMTITGGFTTDNADGAGIYLADNELTLTNVNLTGNNASRNGGGIYVAGGMGTKLTINSSIIAGNSAVNGNPTVTTNGGGIYGNSSSTIEIENSTVANNTAKNGGGFFLNNGTNVNAIGSTFNGNIATTSDAVGNRGGGLMFILTGTAAFTNSTISGNKALVRDGGAILISSFGTAVTLNNTTVAFNEAAGVGGGFKFTDNGQGAIFNSSIVAKNTGGSAPDISGPFTPMNINGSNNLIGVGDGVTFTDPNNLIGSLISPGAPIDPMLKPLANNGGPTMTHALRPGSPALDQGFNILGSVTVPNDQRGANRTYDDPLATPTLIGSDNTDIGSFERQAPVTVTSILVNGNTNVQRSMVTSLKVTFSEAVTFPNGIASAFEVARTQFGTPGKVGLSFSPVTGPTNEVTIMFANGAINIDPAGSLADGRYLLTIIADSVDSSNGTLDGDGDLNSEGSPADNKLSAFHRLFGDANGDGNVTATDFNAFRLVYGQTGASLFDYNGDGSVTASDFNAFRLRYGLSGYQP